MSLLEEYNNLIDIIKSLKVNEKYSEELKAEQLKKLQETTPEEIVDKIKEFEEAFRPVGS